jgi:hypothetical protein
MSLIDERDWRVTTAQRTSQPASDRQVDDRIRGGRAQESIGDVRGLRVVISAGSDAI